MAGKSYFSRPVQELAISGESFLAGHGSAIRRIQKACLPKFVLVTLCLERDMYFWTIVQLLDTPLCM